VTQSSYFIVVSIVCVFVCLYPQAASRNTTTRVCFRGDFSVILSRQNPSWQSRYEESDTSCL